MTIKRGDGGGRRFGTAPAWNEFDPGEQPQSAHSRSFSLRLECHTGGTSSDCPASRIFSSPSNGLYA